MQKFLIIQLSILCLLGAQRKDISGRTIDASDGNPIPGVNIIIKGTTEGTASDLEGKFTFSTTQDYPITLEATHIAYDLNIVVVAKDTLIHIELKPTVIETQEIYVMGVRRKVELDVASAVDRIDIEAIELQGARDIGSALRRVSSLQFRILNR